VGFVTGLIVKRPRLEPGGRRHRAPLRGLRLGAAGPPSIARRPRSCRTVIYLHSRPPRPGDRHGIVTRT
jgi:hypothetical protein